MKWEHLASIPIGIGVAGEDGWLDQEDADMATIMIEVPGDAFSTLRRSPQEFGEEMRLAAAMLWYVQGRISHEKAAQLAGITRIALIDALAAAKLPAFHVDVDELMGEIESVQRADRGYLATGLPGAGGSA